MKKWEIALEKFTKKWENKKEVIGILVCWSYITWNPSKHSDIDIHIILNSNISWRKRWNEIIDWILIEYFMNPITKNYEYLEDDLKSRRKINAHMFATGKIILDKTWDLKKLITHSKKYMKKKYKKQNKFEIEIAKYSIWDMCDNLEEIFDFNGKEFLFVYYNSLSNLFEIYSKFLQFDSSPVHKINRFLTNQKDQKKYHIKTFPDNNFTKKYIQAINIKDKSSMMKEYKNLSNYILEKMGWFNIDGWEIKSSI